QAVQQSSSVVSRRTRTPKPAHLARILCTSTQGPVSEGKSPIRECAAGSRRCATSVPMLFDTFSLVPPQPRLLRLGRSHPRRNEVTLRLAMPPTPAASPATRLASEQ